LKNIDLLRLPEDQISCVEIKRGSRRAENPYKKFIKGPIDLEWIMNACKLPGKTVNVALALWYLSGLKKTKECLNLTCKEYDTFNISRTTVHYALKNLEKSNLIFVDRKPGRKNKINILEVNKANNE